MRNKTVSIFYGAVFFFSITLFLFSKYLHRPSGNDLIGESKQSNEQLYLQNPLKYLFVTDKDGHTISVIDVDERRVADRLSLSEKADIIGVSPLQKTLFYAKQGGKKLYYLNLATLIEHHYDLSIPIDYLSVDRSGKWIVYANERKTVVFNAISKESFEIATKGALSFVFQPNDDVLFIGELDEGRVFHVDLDTRKITGLAELSSPVSDLSIMPNSLALYFNANKKLYRYALLDGKLQTFELGETDHRPYITADSRKLLYLSTSPNELISFNSYTLKAMHRYSLDSVSHIANRIVTGWLERIVVVAGEHALYSFNLETNDTQSTKLEYQIKSMVVHADSKRLFATQQDSQRILVFDIKSQNISHYVDSGLQQPDKVFMLQSNTLCH